MLYTVADPGFPVGGGGRGPLMQALFNENVCENERIGGMRPARPLDLPMVQSDLLNSSLKYAEILQQTNRGD